MQRVLGVKDRKRWGAARTEEPRDSSQQGFQLQLSSQPTGWLEGRMKAAPLAGSALKNPDEKNKNTRTHTQARTHVTRRTAGCASRNR